MLAVPPAWRSWVEPQRGSLGAGEGVPLGAVKMKLQWIESGQSVRGAGTGGVPYSPAGAPSRTTLTGLSNGSQSQGCSSFGSEPDWNGVGVQTPKGIALCRRVGPRNLNAILSPLFYAFLCHFSTLLPARSFFFPSFFLRIQKWLPGKDLEVLGALLFGERPCRRDFWEAAF